MADFTLRKYRELLMALSQSGMSFELIHDVDKRPRCALRIARLESELGVSSAYYFRMPMHRYSKHIIRQIKDLGHTVGYHYESYARCAGNAEAAYRDFCQNFHSLSAIVGSPITTISMHGSPYSAIDNRELWKYYDYHELGVLRDPHLDTDFSTTFYLTDTGRRWDGSKVSVRDKVSDYQDYWDNIGLTFHSTDDLVLSLNDASSLLRKTYHSIMITAHPQRWMPMGLGWAKELLLQNLKNIVKKIVVRRLGN